MGLGSLAVIGAWNVVSFAVYAWLNTFRLCSIPPSPLGWIAVMVAWDFAYYWDHRFSHEIRLFWAAHVNHHSSRAYNLSTALRQPWTALQTTLFVAPLALLGFSAEMLYLAWGFNLIYQYWVHTEVVGRLGPLEWVLNTPSHHRVHHGANPQYLDKNYGGILILWDRLFGTFAPEIEPPVYGLTKNIDTYNPLRIAFHEWIALARDMAGAASLGEALRYALARPGWAPARDRTAN